MFGRLFGADKHINNLLDKDDGLLVKAGQFIGNLSHTEEDKAEANQVTRELSIRMLGALEPFKIMQRILATAIISMWAFGGVNYLAAVWYESLSGVDHQLSNGIFLFITSDYLFWPTVTMLSLYFSGGVIESVKRKLN